MWVGRNACAAASTPRRPKGGRGCRQSGGRWGPGVWPYLCQTGSASACVPTGGSGDTPASTRKGPRASCFCCAQRADWWRVVGTQPGAPCSPTGGRRHRRPWRGGGANRDHRKEAGKKHDCASFSVSQWSLSDSKTVGAEISPCLRCSTRPAVSRLLGTLAAIAAACPHSRREDVASCLKCTSGMWRVGRSVG